MPPTPLMVAMAASGGGAMVDAAAAEASTMRMRQERERRQQRQQTQGKGSAAFGVVSVSAVAMCPQVTSSQAPSSQQPAAGSGVNIRAHFAAKKQKKQHEREEQLLREQQLLRERGELQAAHIAQNELDDADEDDEDPWVNRGSKRKAGAVVKKKRTVIQSDSDSG